MSLRCIALLHLDHLKFQEPMDRAQGSSDAWRFSLLTHIVHHIEYFFSLLVRFNCDFSLPHSRFACMVCLFSIDKTRHHAAFIAFIGRLQSVCTLHRYLICFENSRFPLYATGCDEILLCKFHVDRTQSYAVSTRFIFALKIYMIVKGRRRDRVTTINGDKQCHWKPII